MNQGHKEIQEALNNYYKDLNKFLKMQEIKESLEKLRELSNKANNK
jgi:hypothetical protein